MSETRDSEAYDGEVYEDVRTLLPAFLEQGQLDPAIRKEVNARFLEGNFELPQFIYPYIRSEQVKVKREKLQQLISQFVETTHPAVARLYTSKLEEAQKQFSIILSTEQKAYEYIGELGCEIYGTPSKEMLASVLGRLQDTFEISTPEADQYKEMLADLFEFDIEATSIQSLLTERGIEAPQDDEPISYDEVVEACQKKIEKLSPTEWTAHIDTTGTFHGFMAQTSTRRLVIPSEEIWDIRTDTHGRSAFNALLEHEALHIEQATNGLRSKLRLLESGLAYSFWTEEASTTYIEAKRAGARDLPRYQHALAVALCLGSIDGVKRNFVDVYKLLFPALILEELTCESAQTLEHAKRSAHNRALLSCFRIFKYTDGKTPGVCVPKDISYREGSIHHIRAMLDGAFPFEWFTLGLFDPLNAEHVQSLRELGIIESYLHSVTLLDFVRLKKNGHVIFIRGKNRT